MKTEKQIRKMQEILYKEIDLQIEKGLTIKDVKVKEIHTMLGTLEMVLRDDLNLVFSKDLEKRYWFITQHKNRFIVFETIDRDRESDKKRKAQGNYFKEKHKAWDVLIGLMTALRKNREELEGK